VEQSIFGLKQYQAQLFGEFSDITSLVWWLAIASSCWFITSFKTTNQARAYTLASCISAFLIERLLQTQKQTIRSVALLTIFGIILNAKHKYVDYSKRSCQMIDTIAKEI